MEFKRFAGSPLTGSIHKTQSYRSRALGRFASMTMPIMYTSTKEPKHQQLADCRTSLFIRPRTRIGGSNECGRIACMSAGNATCGICWRLGLTESHTS